MNIQLEYGTLGITPRQIMRRFNWMADAAPALSVTFHTIARPQKYNFREMFFQCLHGGFGNAVRLARNNLRERRNARVYAKLRRLQSVKPVRLIIHTATDGKFLADAYGFTHIFDHPLAFHSAQKAREIRDQARRSRFPALDDLPADAKLVGTFGFLSSHKGIETVIRAIKTLPDDHHLLIFGGVHPQGIVEYRPVDPYTKLLLSEAAKGGGAQRIHFMGALGDADFLAGMAICDAVILPYIETGQTSSGSISQAVELGCRVIAARNHAFNEFGRYHPGCVEYFDIGNHLELAEHIRSRPIFSPQARAVRYDTGTNAALYARAHKLP